MNMLDKIKDKLTNIKKKISPDQIELGPMQGIILNRYEQEEMKDAVNEAYETNDDTNDQDTIDPGYLLHSSEVVGYDTREHQWNTYRTTFNYLPIGDSVLDFGCGRGDFKSVYESETGNNLIYTGLELSRAFTDAAKELYPEYDIRLVDWFNIPDELMSDWCINVHSLNLRYDADLTKDNTEYRQATIKQMYKHANKGVIVMLASDIAQIDDGLIASNPGELLNWAQKEFGNVALDHTFSGELFALIIYKS